VKNPSINLINYLAFDIYDESLHIELFEAILKKSSLEFHEVQGYFDQQGVRKKDFRTVKNRVQKNGNVTICAGALLSEALPLYTRNAIHHPDETGRSFTDSTDSDLNDLKESIEIMLRLL
jgi:hypothetical protein